MNAFQSLSLVVSQGPAGYSEGVAAAGAQFASMASQATLLQPNAKVGSDNGSLNSAPVVRAGGRRLQDSSSEQVQFSLPNKLTCAAVIWLAGLILARQPACLPVCLTDCPLTRLPGSAGCTRGLPSP